MLWLFALFGVARILDKQNRQQLTKIPRILFSLFDLAFFLSFALSWSSRRHHVLSVCALCIGSAFFLWFSFWVLHFRSAIQSDLIRSSVLARSVGIVGFVAVLLGHPWYRADLTLFLQIDACLDRGEAWDYDRNVCTDAADSEN